MLRKEAIFLVGLHWGHLPGRFHLLDPAYHPLLLYILVSYSLDKVVTKRIAYNEKFVHLQIGSCKCQYLGALGPNRQWTYALVTSWPSSNPNFWSCEVNRWVKSYLPDELILSALGSYTIVLYKPFVKTIILYQFSLFFKNLVDIIKTNWSKLAENAWRGIIYEVNFNKFHKSFLRFPVIRAFLDRTKPKNCAFLRFQNFHLQ